MTVDELDTLAGIAAAVRRIEERQQRDGDRLAALERSANRMDGALTAAKVLLGVFGFGGIVWFIGSLAEKAS